MQRIPMRLELGKPYYVDINRYYVFYGYNEVKGKYYGEYVRPSGYSSTATLFEDGDKIYELLRNRNKPHPHAKLMAQYAEDAKKTEEPWLLWEFKDIRRQLWIPFISSNPRWCTHVEYRRKQQ